MEILLILIVAAIGYFIYKKVLSSRMKVSDDRFEQHGVVVDFTSQTINIKGHSYNVSQITGLRTIADGRSVKGVEISVDDFKHPIHKVSTPGMPRSESEFMQRLSVALRKAGGPSFI
jgi:hypothetical protein